MNDLHALVMLQDRLPLEPTQLAPPLAKAVGRPRIDLVGALKRNPYIPLEDLQQEAAAAAVACLKENGIPSFAAAVDRVPPASRVFSVLNADVRDDGLQVQTDLAGTLRGLPWGDIGVAAAVTVSETSKPLGLSAESVREQVEELREASRWMNRGVGSSHLVHTEVPEVQSRTSHYPVLCLLPRGVDAELRIRGDMFNYDYLGDRLCQRSTENFRLLAADILARLADALVDCHVRKLAETGEPPPVLEVIMLGHRNRWLRLLAGEGRVPEWSA